MVLVTRTPKVAVLDLSTVLCACIPKPLRAAACTSYYSFDADQPVYVMLPAFLKVLKRGFELCLDTYFWILRGLCNIALLVVHEIRRVLVQNAV